VVLIQFSRSEIEL